MAEKLSHIPNIDQIFEEGREPTEEEWKVWAENFKPKSITERKPEHEARLKKRKAKVALYDKERKRKEYQARKETNHKSWGDKYNAKRRYLSKYNEEYRERLAQEFQRREYKKNTQRYSYWVNKYRKIYKNKLKDFANTYKISEDVYVLGFSKSQMQVIGPLIAGYYNNFERELLWPPMKYEGYKFKNKKISSKLEPFYLLTEAVAYFSVFDKHKTKIGVYTEEKKAFLKKQFWEEMIQARKDFENE